MGLDLDALGISPQEELGLYKERTAGAGTSHRSTSLLPVPPRVILEGVLARARAGNASTHRRSAWGRSRPACRPRWEIAAKSNPLSLGRTRMKTHFVWTAGRNHHGLESRHRRSIAETMARRGAKVVISSRKAEPCEEVAAHQGEGARRRSFPAISAGRTRSRRWSPRRRRNGDRSTSWSATRP